MCCCGCLCFGRWKWFYGMDRKVEYFCLLPPATAAQEDTLKRVLNVKHNF